MLKAHIFDFDGTLVDSMPTWIEKVLNILRTCKIDYTDDLLPHIVTLGDAGTARYFQEVLGVPLSLDEMFAMMDEYALPRYSNLVPVKEGVREYLEYLRSQGCSLNVLTASPHKMLDPCLKRLGIYDWFDNVWSCDDFGTTKSNPDIYLQAAARIGSAPEETVFYDDSLAAIRTAKQAGLPTVGIYDEYAAAFLSDMQRECGKFAFQMTELIEE